jgi:hypothetical protein
MNIKSTMKKSAMIGALGLSLAAFTAVPGNAVLAAETSPSAQKLVDSLKALNIGEVDYLYAYLQSVDLSDSEYNGILANSKQVTQILKGTANPENLPAAQKAEISRLFLDSVKLAHLQAAFVDNNGNPIDITTVRPSNMKNIKIQLKDMKGNVLATVNPSKKDLSPAALEAKMVALSNAIEAKEELEKTGTFVPMPNAPLPNTASNNVEYMALGGLLILLGGVAVVPAARLVRKSDVLPEA